ncbi:MAG: MFS transporter [Actinobacteria bacterium]|nr:MFS transporter [Actinomycetota bacterium]
MTGLRLLTSKTFEALSIRNFRIYFLGQLASFSGTWMQAVAQGWLVLELGGGGVALGTAIALQYVPMLLLGSWGGLIADRLDKRKLLLATNTSAGLLGVVNLFDNPARQSFIIELVGRDKLSNAISLNSVLINGARAIGPAIAAVLIATVGIAACFYVNAASYVLALAALCLIRGSELRPSKPLKRTRGQVREGLRYVADNPSLRQPLLAMAAVGTFAFNFTTSLPLLAKITFHAHASLYGAMMAAMGIGAIGGGLYIAHRSRPSERLLGVLGLCFAMVMAVLALAPSPGLAVAALVPMGAFSIAYVSTTNSLLQLQTAAQFRGRVMALHAIAFLGSTPIGAPIIGAIAAGLSPRLAIGLGALATFLATLPFLRGRKGQVLAVAKPHELAEA